MVNINIVALGKLRDSFYIDGCNEFLKRITPFCKINVIELDEKKTIDEEAPFILKACKNTKIIALCVEGKEYTSNEFANLLSSLPQKGISQISFVIGSSEGLSQMVKDEAYLKISLSKMTLPHKMARLVLCEQIYRACEIECGGKYHK